MLRHPFFGVVVPNGGDDVHHTAVHDGALDSTATGRRTFLSQVSGLLAGAVALLLGRSSVGQEGRIDGAVITPGAIRGQPVPNSGGYTTQALGEEGSAYPPPTQPMPPPPGVVTTYAVGEEAGYGRPPYSTYPPPGTVTTYAVGEEAGYGSGGYYYRPRRYFYGRPRYYYRY